MQERDVILVYGKTGMGKSRWTRRYLKSKQRVIIVDPMREHDGQLVEDLGEVIDTVEAYPTFRVRSEWSHETPVLASIAMAANDPRKWGGDGPENIMKIPELTFVVEEAQRAMSPRSNLHPAIEQILLRGRHHRVTPLFISQRPSTVHIMARSQWTRLVVFHQTEGGDTRWLEEQSGINREEFSMLGPGEYFDISPTESSRLILPDQRGTIASRRETLRHATSHEEEE